MVQASHKPYFLEYKICNWCCEPALPNSKIFQGKDQVFHLECVVNEYLIGLGNLQLPQKRQVSLPLMHQNHLKYNYPKL